MANYELDEIWELQRALVPEGFLYPELLERGVYPPLVKSLRGELMEFIAPSDPGPISSVREIEDVLLSLVKGQGGLGVAGHLLAEWRSISPVDIGTDVKRSVAELILPAHVETRIILTHKPDAHRIICNTRARTCFERVLFGKWMYSTAVRTEEKPNIFHINPCQTIFSMRSFYYQLCLQNAYIPERTDADEFILECADNLFGVRPIESNGGLIFELEAFRQIMLENVEIQPANGVASVPTT